ncbi:MAG: hypothetical protein M1542_08415 [Thermotogae bacterium]|nr:hypothetical protein [Thermotogota bacterium]
MSLEQLTNYGSSTSTPDLTQQLKQSNKYIGSLSSSMSQINSQAQGWLAQNGQLTAAQTNLTNINILQTSLSNLAGLTASIKSFVNNWSNYKSIFKQDLNNLTTFLSGNWVTYSNNLSTSLSTVGSLLTKISTANSNIQTLLNNNNKQLANMISTQVSSNGQSTVNLLTAIQSDQATINTDVAAWTQNESYVLAIMGSTSQIPTAISSLYNATNANSITSSLQSMVNALTATTLVDSTGHLLNASSVNLTNLIPLDIQFSAWQQYFSTNFSNLVSQISTDMTNVKAGNGNISVLSADFTALTTYVSMLYTLSQYWSFALQIVNAVMSNMTTEINTLAKDTNAFYNILKAAVSYINSYLHSHYSVQATQNMADLQQIQSNIQSYSAELSALSTANGSSLPSDFNLFRMLIIGGILVGTAFIAWVWTKKKGGKKNG